MTGSFRRELLERRIGSCVEERLHDPRRAEVFAEYRRRLLRADLLDAMTHGLPRPGQLDLSRRPRVPDPLALAVRRDEPRRPVVDHEAHWGRVATAGLPPGHREDVRPLPSDAEPD